MDNYVACVGRLNRDIDHLCTLLGADEMETMILKQNLMWHRKYLWGLPEIDKAQLEIEWESPPSEEVTPTGM